MKYCINCGNELVEGAKFCANCGNAVSSKNSYSQRKTVYDGELHKCPNCGEIINSFVSICPMCGFELNRKQVSLALKDFIYMVNECEQFIEDSPQAGKIGWASWGKGKRFWWVILNIFFVCIPLVIYLALPLAMVKITPKLTKEEKRMASLIENFAFPNDRESILSALIYAKEKIDFISKEKINRKTAYWMRLWCAKAEQLKEKADMLFPNDPIVKSSYAEIKADEERVSKLLKFKAIIGLVILIVAVAFLVVRYGKTQEQGERVDNTDYTVTYEWPSTGLNQYLPLPPTEYGKIKTDDSSRFSIEVYQISTNEFNDYVKACKENGFTIRTTKTDSVFYSYHVEQYELSIFYYDEKELMDVFLDAPEKMSNIKWPSSDIAKKLPIPDVFFGHIWNDTAERFGVNIANVSQADFSDYIDVCMEKGFTIDYVREDDFFKAYNKAGDELTLRLQVFDVMQIYIETSIND